MPAKAAERAGGRAGISPNNLRTSQGGTTLHLSYVPGKDAGEYKTIKFIIPEGLPKPESDPLKEGYFTIDVSDGVVISSDAQDREITVTVHKLMPEKGKVTVNYGSKKSGGPGITAPGETGEYVFRVLTAENDMNEPLEIDVSPILEVN
ncbi:MAG: hypothetical protein ACLFP1_07695 [Candidatus Goldiibacteriota bacterium]